MVIEQAFGFPNITLGEIVVNPSESVEKLETVYEHVISSFTMHGACWPSHSQMRSRHLLGWTKKMREWLKGVQLMIDRQFSPVIIIRKDWGKSVLHFICTLDVTR